MNESQFLTKASTMMGAMREILNNKARKVQHLNRVQQNLIVPFQIQEVPTWAGDFYLTDPLYQDFVRNTRKGSWSRSLGESEPGVKVIVPSNGKFRKLMDYRYYRIPDLKPYGPKYLRARRVRCISTLRSLLQT